MHDREGQGKDQQEENATDRVLTSPKGPKGDALQMLYEEQ